MSINAYTTAPDGTDRRPVEALGVISALTWSSAWPGGDGDCTLSVNLPADANPPGLRLGRRLTVLDGVVPVWTGILADPQRGAPWTVTAQGLASLAPRYLALSTISSGHYTQVTNANTAVTNAIARGLPWTLTQTLPTPTVTTPTSPDLSTLLDAVATAAGQRWAVDQNGYLSMAADPTAPAYLLVASNTPGGRTTDDYATDLYAQTSGTTTITPAASTLPSLGPFGRWERVYYGPSSNIANAVKLVQPDPAFSGDVTVLPGDLCTLGGQPVRLSTVRAGQMVRAIGVQPDPVTGQATFTASVNITIGEWRYDAVADTAQLTPLGSTRQDITTLLTAAAATNLQGVFT